ncbi:ATP-binding protein [Kitasatospora sp. NPDC048365]|uniref:ATP-binding protein n=1 Tax=Kitasatospora sp. NPDC048365 TaxID=3364050 RepID=UPI00371AA7AA
MSSTPQRRSARHADTTDSSGAEARPGRVLPAAERGAWTAGATFPPLPRNVARARRLASTALSAWGVKHLADSVELVVSELVTNAVRYGRGAVSISLTLQESALQISVADYGHGMPQMREAGEEDSNGRGLAIVSALCTRWAVTTRLTGKTVSCWLAVEPPPIEVK